MSEPSPFSPRGFLRAKRPERYSDSISDDQPTLNRTILEYHLGTLTNRSQETDFQNFARHLAEKEICPNLLPQTGPTGGGDSKVDTETYPVSDDLSMCWYVGIGREAASERWAFAISAKEDWRGKVNSDIRKIAGTNRGYAKAFFISNQFVRDRERAEVEDNLTKKYGFDVRILDRNWILDKLFAGRHETLAVEDLRLEPTLRPQIRKGPRDTQRETDLNDIETKIKATAESGQFGFQFVDDCLVAAELSRGLERPRTETDGRFIRAERAAAQYGTIHQQLRCAYEYAWTAYFWHEDFALASQLYSTVEIKAKGTTSAYDLELLSNLWKLLFSIERAGRLDKSSANINVRAETLVAELERLAGEEDRPSNALHARSILLLTQMVRSGHNEVDRHLEGLREVILASEGLVGFPLEPVVESLMEIGNYLGTYATYDKLHETIVEVVAKRKGEVGAAHLLLKRGAQQLDSDRPVEAVRVVGRALAKLFKHESRHELVMALSLCGAAYERLGLLWAARGATLTAASLATTEYWTYADVTLQQAACYRRMKWLELQLGRVPHVLAWHETDSAARAILAQQGYDSQDLNSGEIDFDAIFAILLLRTDIWQLNWLTTLPDVLEGLGLFMAADAIRYALGHEDAMPDEITKDGSDSETLRKFFLLLRDQPAGKELPPSPLFCDGQTLILNSIVLGCNVSVECVNEPASVALAESLLAALEGLLASGLVDRFGAREPLLTIRVRTSDFCDGPFSFEVQERDGRPHVEISCGPFDPNGMSPDAQVQLRSQLSELLGTILGRAFIFPDLEESLKKLFGDDRAMERAVAFTSSFVVLGNVLGKVPRTDISRWKDSNARDYQLKREKSWDADVPMSAPPDASAETLRPGSGSGEHITDEIKAGRVKHSDVQFASPIRESLWDDAGWCGNGFMFYEGKIPILAPNFRNAKPAAQIFAHWRSEFGEVDSNDRLRVSIIRGIRRDHPHWYRIMFGSNPVRAPGVTEIQLMIMKTRVQTMEPDSNANLSAFLNRYQAEGRYTLAHSIRKGDSGAEFVCENYIGKYKLHLVEAWQVGRNDLESLAILPDDDPIIPPDQPNARVLEVLGIKRERQGVPDANAAGQNGVDS